jgi:hypothetical protein
MSELNDDKKVITEGRKNSLNSGDNDVSAPLRDQIPQKLKEELDEQNIGAKISTMWHTGNANRREWLVRQEEYLEDWDEFLVSTDEGPFNGASTLHLPMALTVAKTLHSRFFQAIMGIEPPFHTKARNEASAPRVHAVHETMKYALKRWANNYEGVQDVIDNWLWDWVTTGVGILKQRWDVKYTRYMDVQDVPEEGAVDIVINEDGTETSVPTIKLVEKEVERVKKVFEGPCFELVRPEDFIIIGGQGNPQNADAVIQREWLTASDLWTLADRKIFDEDEVEKIVQGGADYVGGSENSNIKQMRAQNAGQDNLDTDVDLDRYEILEAYLKIDVDGSGINSDVIVWIHGPSKRILRSTYLRRVNKAGEVPFFKIDFHKRIGQEYGIGIVEMMHPLSVEMDAMHNMRIDFGMISTMPFGFYRPTSGIDPEVIEFEPGSLIPVDNPQSDVFFPNLGNRTAFGFNEEQALQSMIERLTGISDINLGVVSSTQGATRTATGTRAVIGESSSNLDVYLRRANLGWGKAIRYLFHMLQQRIPENLTFRITGETGEDYWGYIKNRDDLAGDFDFELDSNSANSNQQVRIQNADVIAQLQQDPLAIQLGIIGPLELYEAKKFQLQSRGIQEVGKYFKQPQEQRIFTPEEEANRILRGIETPVTLNSDHEGYINYYQEVIQGNIEQLSEMYPPEVFIALEAQAQRHAQMLQAIEQVAAQQRNQFQQQANAQNPQNAQPGINPLSGQGSNEQ